jgi:hypothetical protein
MRKGAYLVIVIAAAFVAFVVYSLVNVQAVQVAEMHLQHRGAEVFVEGKLKNTSDRTAAVELEVHYYDKDGRPLGQDRLTLDNLRAGSMTSFKSPAHELSGVADFSLFLNHGRNPYGN